MEIEPRSMTVVTATMMKAIWFTFIFSAAFTLHSQVDSNRVDRISQRYFQECIKSYLPDSAIVTRGSEHLNGMRTLLSDCSVDKSVKVLDSFFYKCAYRVVARNSRMYADDYRMFMASVDALIDSSYFVDLPLTSALIPKMRLHGHVEIQDMDLRLLGSDLTGSDSIRLLDLDPSSHSSEIMTYPINENFILVRNIERREGGATYWTTESWWYFVKEE